MTQFLRPNIRAMAGHVPGEQPREDGIIKLNTNENPYPPSPRVAEAIERVLRSERLRKYPEPMGATFRQTAGRVLGVDPEAILIGNGSDDILTILTRAFVPEGGLIVSPTPSYLLYKTLAEIQGARFLGVPYVEGWMLPATWPLPDANLTLVANPNSPSGTVSSLEELESLAKQLKGPLVVDEAYVDFAEQHALPLTRLSNVIVSRTLSKSYGLAGLRFGFAVASPVLVRELVKVKDSYNCDMRQPRRCCRRSGGSGLAAGESHEDPDHLPVLASALASLGFHVRPATPTSSGRPAAIGR
ncbi:MAG: aminotransferase class I/II-fold pyridoxal phosphate-dependent enzyme [Gemmataceae bacterium]